MSNSGKQHDYRTMTLSAIIDDLCETVADLVLNAGEDQLRPQFESLNGIEFPEGARPSIKLVTVMEELYTFDADLLAPRAQELIRAAVDEIRSLHDRPA